VNLKELMKTYGVFSLVLNLETLEACEKALAAADKQKFSLDDEFIKILGGLLSRLKENCENLSADSSLVKAISDVEKKLSDKTGDMRESVLLTQVRMIHDGINDNLAKRHFMILSEEESSFYVNPDLFGNSFKEKYPMQAMKDAFDAGNCYAASLYTACVFHCMRVAEYGLRKLARNAFLKVKLTQKKGKPHPIEYADWQKVIEGIRSKIVKIRQRPVGPKRDQDIRFLSTAADHCEYMKDIWRNELSHTRRWYKKEEALSVISRVKEFVVAIGEHSGSSPAEDSITRLIAQAMAAQSTQTSLALPSLPSPPSTPSSG
jgi:hypothetical protein